jgi:hypothetical protein
MFYFCSFFFINRNMDASKKIIVITEIIVFDFELFIGSRCRKKGRAGNSSTSPFKYFVPSGLIYCARAAILTGLKASS